MHKLATLLLTVFILCFTTTSGFSYPITFVHSGIGSGNLNDTYFTNRNFTITAYGDTDDVMRRDRFNALWTGHSAAFIDIDQLGIFQLQIPTQTFVNYSVQVFGFSDSRNISDLFDGPYDLSAATWDMQTSIGPFSGVGFQGVSAHVFYWDGIPTDGGSLFFTPDTSYATFQAIVQTSPVPTPEPSTFMLLFVGLFGLVAIGCMKFGRARIGASA
ncbi:PEP-CTERM sorting domain-containing protein [Pseudodesulfovibrio methanolicus]|uniref:PEP-CTERM sorting domain-containing protein n=1 Tax=Pseudodesulfovibrio methanolicus TaxID=3126690 RepID=A0ABZ2IYP7_9BACT